MPLLLGIGGGGARAVSFFPGSDGYQIMALDTDSRTEERYPDLRLITVGSRLVRGEGTGGNMNLARACFRVDLEEIAPIIIGRPLVMMVSSCSGSTGLAGSVELSQLLSKVGMPFFNILLHGPEQVKGGMDPLQLASILLDGPLRPGIIMEEKTEGSGQRDPFGINEPVDMILRASKRSGPFHIPSGAWEGLREDGGPFEIGTMELPSPCSELAMKAPAVVSMMVPESMSTEEVKRIVSMAFGRGEEVSIGMLWEPSIRTVRFAFISRSASSPPSQQGPPPDPEALRALLDNSLETGLGPWTDIAR